MSGPAKGKVSISIELSADKCAYVESRGEPLEWSRKKVLERAIDFWLALGAPALSDLEAARPVAPVPGAARVPLISAWVKYAGKHPPAPLPVRN